MIKETLEQNTRIVIPESFNLPKNKALLEQALLPFRDWEVFSKLPEDDILAAYETLMKAVLTAFGIKANIKFESKRSANYGGIFLKPSTIVLNNFLLRSKHSVHTIIHECAHVYLYCIRAGDIPFEDKILYDSYCDFYHDYMNSNGFHTQPEEIYADLVAYQLLQKYKFPMVYSISYKQNASRIKNYRLKAAIPIIEFILVFVLLVLIKFMPIIVLPVLIILFFLFRGIHKRMFWLDECLKGKGKRQLVGERFEQLMTLWNDHL